MPAHGSGQQPASKVSPKLLSPRSSSQPAAASSPVPRAGGGARVGCGAKDLRRDPSASLHVLELVSSWPRWDLSVHL